MLVTLRSEFEEQFVSFIDLLTDLQGSQVVKMIRDRFLFQTPELLSNTHAWLTAVVYKYTDKSQMSILKKKIVFLSYHTSVVSHEAESIIVLFEPQSLMD